MESINCFNYLVEYNNNYMSKYRKNHFLLQNSNNVNKTAKIRSSSGNKLNICVKIKTHNQLEIMQFALILCVCCIYCAQIVITQ